MSWEIEFLLWLQEVVPFKGFFALITHLGDVGFFWIVLGLILVVNKKHRKQGFHLLIAIALMGLAVNVTIKPLVARIRPFNVYPIDLLVNAPHGYSFPSGHTAVSFASAFVLGKCYPKLKVPVYILAGIIAFSRLVLFVHYPTDVLCGMIVGLACGYISMRCFKIKAKS